MNTFNEVIERYAAQIRTADVIEIADIPTIDLYMDQVTTFMDKGLARYKRNETDKILTKTMINNYTKAKIFPPPVKKKYSRTHLMLLIMIYHLKAILSIKDIGVLFHVALAEPDAEKQAQQIETIYAGFVALQKSTYAYLANMAENKADDSFYGKDIMLGCEDRELRRILLVLGLVIRANTEKQLAEHALDAYFYLSEQTKLIRFGNPVQNTVFLEQINQRASQRGALLQFLKCIEFTVLSPFHNALRRIHA